MLDVSNIQTFYGDSQVLYGVSFDVAKGQAVALLGRNGMGKTTCVRSLLGFTRPRAGSVHFKGEAIEKLPSHLISQRGIALVPQGHRMFGSLSVQENLCIGARGDGWSLERIYSLFPMLKIRANSFANRLSGGEQQIAALARALMTNPDLLILDEPSEGLAPIVIDQICDVLIELKNQGLSILMVEQNLPFALRLCDVAYIIASGKITYRGSSQDLAADSQTQLKALAVYGEIS